MNEVYKNTFSALSLLYNNTLPPSIIVSHHEKQSKSKGGPFGWENLARFRSNTKK